MLHSLDEVQKKIKGMHDLVEMAKANIDNPELFKHYIESMQSLAGDIYNDRQDKDLSS